MKGEETCEGRKKGNKEFRQAVEGREERQVKENTEM